MNAASPPPHVCIVDDEAGVRDLLQLMCESIESTATTYASAEAFLSRLDSLPSEFDLVVLDVDMPGMNGLELLDTLRQRGFLQPVIMISGGNDASKTAAARRLGAAHFFDKPFDVGAVRQCIAGLLGPDGASGDCGCSRGPADGATSDADVSPVGPAP